VIRTSDEQLDNAEVAKAYRDLQRIERSFRSLKSLEEINPVYHWRERRIRAHVYVCVLAHLLERYLEKKLHAKGVKMTAAEALKHLSRIKSARIEINGETCRLRSEAAAEAVTIFQALGYRLPPRIVLLAKDDRDAKTAASRVQNALA
jgi:transposase